VEAPGATSGNFQRRARKISLNGCSTSGGTSPRGPVEEEEQVLHLDIISVVTERFVIKKVMYMSIKINYSL
jgi:hypothetical protein